MPLTGAGENNGSQMVPTYPCRGRYGANEYFGPPLGVVKKVLFFLFTHIAEAFYKNLYCLFSRHFFSPHALNIAVRTSHCLANRSALK